jgi:hypothetical protein
MPGVIAPEQAQPGDLILCRANPKSARPWLDRLVTWVTNSSTIHVAMVHDDCWALEANWPVLRAWPRAVYGNCTYLRVSDDPLVRRYAVEQYMTLLGKRYSLWLLVLEFFRLTTHKALPSWWLKTLYVCSTSVARAYWDRLDLVPGVSRFEVTPGEIAACYGVNPHGVDKRHPAVAVVATPPPSLKTLLSPPTG